MKVKFEATWFAPGDVEKVDKLRIRSGQRFKRGIQEVPDSLKPYLPKSCTILEDTYVAPVEEKPEETLRDFDTVRQEADIV